MIESGSSLATFLDCPRKYYYKYEKMLDSQGYSSALSLGTLVHACIEMWSGKGDRFAFSKAYDQIVQRVTPELQSSLANDAIKAAGIFNAWSDYWGKEHPFGNDKWEWIYAEKEFSFPINEEDDRHVGKIDGIIRHKEWDKVFVYELKTAADREHDSYVHRLGVDRQVSANIYAAQEMGFEVDGILYDIIWKPMIRQKKEETETDLRVRFVSLLAEKPEYYFQREVIYRKDEDIQDHLTDVRHQFAALETARVNKHFYRNSGACDQFGSLCAFFSVCQENKPELESLYRKREKRLPELSAEAQKESQ